MVSMTPLDALKNYFGFDEFRPGQKQIIDAIMGGRDALAVMPTGAGKSICYQIPALCMDGITLVVSPLISLMKDQVSSLVQAGVPAAYLNSSLSAAQYTKALQLFQAGKYKIVYIAPERLLTDRFIQCIRNLRISMIAVDEAHCISQWGQNFRPDYLKIPVFISLLGYRPVIGAFTATATDQVKEDILNNLELNDPFRLTAGFDRPNLFFSVIHTEDKDKVILKLLRQYRKKSGIIYCATRNHVEEVTEMLCDHGYKAVGYHAGMSEETRRKNQESFSDDSTPVIAATNAFGMGIDKSNVSFVIHDHMPMSMEAYYQEAGRAGRDDEPADCILLYSEDDVSLNKYILEHSEPNPAYSEEMQKMIRKRDLERLKVMKKYAETSECLRHYILSYFGEDSPAYCASCSSCRDHFTETDITIEAQKILSAVIRTGQRYGIGMVIDVLCGRVTERIEEKGFDKLSVFGILDCGRKEAESLIKELEWQGYLHASDDQYQVLTCDPSAGNVLKGLKKVTRFVPKSRVSSFSEADEELLEKLRQMRLSEARNEKVPAYTIFSDAVLKQIVQKKPKSAAQLKQISGIGKKKAQKYGKKILKIVKSS